MLEGPHVRLEPLGPEEISDEYVAWLNDPETFRYLDTKFGQTRTSVRRYVELFAPPNMLCKIVRKADSRHVGNIALHHFAPVHRRMELGILIGTADARGAGIGREACSLIIQFGFDHLNLHKITAGTVTDNVAMTKVFLRLGFTIEGTLSQHYFLEGTFHDVHRFGLLRDRFVPAGATS